MDLAWNPVNGARNGRSDMSKRT